MTAALESVWQNAPGGCALVVSGNRIIFQANADRPVVPASVTKLLTASAALDILGADTRFTTAVVGEIDAGGVIEGNLWIVGGGDPVLGTNAWATRDGAQAKLHTSLDGWRTASWQQACGGLSTMWLATRLATTPSESCRAGPVASSPMVRPDR